MCFNKVVLSMYRSATPTQHNKAVLDVQCPICPLTHPYVHPESFSDLNEIQYVGRG